MHTLRHYIDIVSEMRSHSELNPKLSNIDILNQYSSRPDSDLLYVHFNNIEKVGVNPMSKNTYGPRAVYAFPLNYTIQYYERIMRSAPRNVKYFNILKSKPGINILNMNTLTNDDVEKIKSFFTTLYNKKIDSDITGNPKHNFQIFKRDVALSSFEKKDGSGLNNTFFRKLGYDAIYDSSGVMNDNPNQMIFLTPKAYEIVLTSPFRKTTA